MLFPDQPSQPHRRHRLVRLCLSIIIAFTYACLPVDVVQPECYPEEGCPINFECLEGRCTQAKKKNVKIVLNCLRHFGCFDHLVRLGFERACLIIEQPSALYGVPFNFTQAREEDGVLLSLAVQEAPLRSSIVLMSGVVSEECPQSVSEIEAKGLHRHCDQDIGCLLRLRAGTINVEQIGQQVIELNFDGADGQCIESLWGEEVVAEEQCGGEDQDCDGFVDEGLQCERESQ